MLKHAHIIAVLVGIIVLTPSITIVSVSNINTPCTTMQVLTDDGVPVVFDVIKKPAASSNAPVAVLIHGFSGNRKMMKMIGLALADKGVVSVLVDLRGHGDSGGFMSYVNSFDADIQAVLGELASKSLGNISRLVFIGHSMGGSVAVNMSKILQPLATVGIAPAISPSSVNITDPENLLLIISEGDTVIDNQAVINAFYESINGTGEPNIIYYAGGSEKKLFTDDYSDHLSVLYRPPVIDEIVKWVTRIVLGVEESSSINSDLIGACVFSAVIGGLMILLPFGHKILQYFRKRNGTPLVTVDIRPRKAFIYSVIGFIAASVGGAGLTVLLSLPFFIVSPLLFTNFVTALFLGNSIAIGVLGGVQLRRKIGKSFFKRFFNLMLTRNLIYNLIAGFILGVLLIILFYTTIGSNTTSTLSTSPVRLAFLMLYLPVYLLVFLLYELFFRGLIRHELGSGVLSAITSCIIQITVMLSSLLIQILIATVILQQNVSFILLGLPFIILLVSVSTIISAVFYEASNGWLTQILSNALLLSSIAIALSNIIYIF